MRIPQLRNSRERGLHERLRKRDLALDCPVREIPLPVRDKKGDVKTVQWPFVLPEDLVPWKYVGSYMPFFFWDHRAGGALLCLKGRGVSG